MPIISSGRVEGSLLHVSSWFVPSQRYAPARPQRHRLPDLLLRYLALNAMEVANGLFEARDFIECVGQSAVRDLADHNELPSRQEMRDEHREHADSTGN